MNPQLLRLAALALLAIFGAKVHAADPPKKQSPTQEAIAQIAADLKAFQASPPPAPADAARQWLNLLRRSQDLLPGSYQDIWALRAIDFEAFVLALPRPSFWPALGEEIARLDPKDKAKEQSKYALQYFARRLQGDISGLREDYEKILKLSDSLPPASAPEGAKSIALLEKEIFELSDDGDAILEILNRNLDLAIHKPAKQPSEPRATEPEKPFEIPDLVTLVGAERASAFLGKALRELPVPISIRQGDETRRLAARVALEQAPDLMSAQWALAGSLDAGSLYTALLARFGPGTKGEFRNAQSYEVLRLLLAGQTTEAVKLSVKMTDAEPNALYYVALAEIGHLGRANLACDYFHGLLSQHPNLPYWRDYISVSVRAGQSERMLTLLRTALARPDLHPGTVEDLEKTYAGALLAEGQLDEGVAELIKVARTPSQPVRPGNSTTTTPIFSARRIASLGSLLGRPEWVDQGISLAREILKADQKPRDSFSHTLNITQYSDLLLDVGRGTEAEAVLLDALAHATEPIDGERTPQDRSSEILCALVGVYTATGRSAEVLSLLEQAPGWSATDLSQILDKPCYLGQSKSDSLGGCAARALLNTGQKEKARPIIKALLDQDYESDRNYELLLALDGSSALPILDRLYATDPFQERPLIWKAKLLLDAGQLAEAEKNARQAIKVDPSDGETGSGDRMRVYAVLADILEAKGNSAEAKTFRGIVQAIRLSEKADEFYGQGLISEAIALYEKSLNSFADAYCIQSRLALRQFELGDWKGAEEHYRRAYELMPDSFGRVESHCFGCERAFAGEKQQTLAERVFTKIAAERPDNPQVHYLLGYLRYEQDRYKDALPEFQRAVELDPDYLNAWKKIRSVGLYFHQPAALRNAVALNLLRLEPARELRSLRFDDVTDLAAIWNLLDRRDVSVASISGDIFPLKGSVAALEALIARLPDPALGPELRAQFIERSYRPSTTPPSPGEVFAKLPFTEEIKCLLGVAPAFRPR